MKDYNLNIDYQQEVNDIVACAIDELTDRIENVDQYLDRDCENVPEEVKQNIKGILHGIIKIYNN